MPKKKPIAKRLNNLFKDITPEQTPGESKPTTARHFSTDAASPHPEEKAPKASSRPSFDLSSKTSIPSSSAMSLAFQMGQNNWATLQVLDEVDQRTWSQDDQLLVKQVADQLSLALENAQLFQETQSRAEELAVLNEMGNELSTNLDPTSIVEVVYKYTTRLMDTSNFYVALYDEKNQEKSYPIAFEEGRRLQLSPSKVTGSGFTDYIIRNKKTVFAPVDVLGHMRVLGIDFLPLSEDETPSQCWLGVPMLIGDRVLGVISVQSVQTARLYDEHDRDILTTIASQAAIAVENARLFDEAQRRARETAALAEVGREISSTLDLAQVLERISAYAKDLLGSETCAVYLPDERGEYWNAIAVSGADANEIKSDPIRRGRGLLGNIISKREGNIFNDASFQPGVVTIAGTVEKDFEHLMGTPIMVKESITGLMGVWRTGEGLDFIQTELNFLNSLAQQAAIAIENARLFQNVTDGQAQLSEALRIARIGYFEVGLQSQTIKITDELFSLLNTTAEQEGGYELPLEYTLNKFVVEEDIPTAIQDLQKAIASPDEKNNLTSEVRFRTADGREMWVSTIYRVIRDSKGNAFQVAGSSQDITDRKTNELIQAAITHISESALTSNTLDELIKSVHEAVATLVPAQNFYLALYDPESHMITFPYHVDEIDEEWSPRKLGRGVTSYVIRTSKPLRTTPEIFADLEASGEIINDGARNVDWLGVPLRTKQVVTGVMAVQTYNASIRITDRHTSILSVLASQVASAIERLEAREALAKSEADLRALFSSMQDVVLVVDKDTRYIRIAPTNPSRLFRPPEELLGRRMDEILPPETYEPFREAIRQALETNEVIQIEYKLPIEGHDFWFLANLSRLNEEQVFWVARDITERKTNELTQAAATQISEGALTSRSIEELAKTVHAAISTLVPAENFYLALYDAVSNLISFPYHLDMVDKSWSPRRLGNDLTSYVLRTGKLLQTGSEGLASLEASGEVVNDGINNLDWLGVPLRSKQVVMGVIAIQTYDETSLRITDRHASILSALAPQIASAIERFSAEREIQKFKLGIDRSDNAVFITDLDGTIQYTNPAFEKVYGFSPGEAIGKTPRILKSGLIPAEQYKHFWSTLTSGGTISGELINRRKDGELVPISGTNSPILDESGKIIGFLAVHQDITERKKSEETLKRRNDYLAASSEIGRLVTSTLDLNTIFTRTVNLISERFGFYFASIYIIEETGFHALLREATGEAGEAMKAQRYSIAVGSASTVGKVSESGESILINDTTHDPMHQANPLLLDTQSEVAIPLRIGSRIVGAIDIQSTETFAFTEDDISVLQSLADQVAVAIDNARSYELSQQLIKDLREVDQLKSQFLANMSHELRTPLNSIIGFSRVILKGIDGPVTDLQQQDLTAIYNSGQHLLGLINDILDLARIEAGKMELNFEEVHLSELTTSVLSTAKGLVKEKPIQLIQRIPSDMPTVRGDTMRVRQVLLNLISNASKFTDEGSITVQALTQKGPTGKMEALINVIDTGPGISLEDQEKLFKAFSQVDGSATRKTGGSGLGLSICANLIQLHGGRIGVTSDVGKGSTFWFTIPLFQQPLEKIPADKKIILAIDDDPQVISLYERYLNPQGYYVVPLTDPSKAKDRILELKPFAVTLDIMMPKKDGWSVLMDLKSDPVTRDYPVIICSIIEQADKGFSLGAADYLVKPILEDDLVHALDRLNKNGKIRQVLVIDDDPNDLRLMEKIISTSGRYKAILAEGGRKGWEALNTNAPDAIILDIFMPDMDGFTILEKLHEDPLLRNIPVLVVSGGGLTNEQQKQLRDYGQRLITKGSLKEGELLSNIEESLKQITA